MQLASFWLFYAFGAGISILTFVWARRFSPILRALLQSLGACIAALALVLVAFSFDPHEFDVLIQDFFGAPLFLLGTPAATIGAMWAMRRNGCLALGISAVTGVILGGLVSLVIGNGLFVFSMVLTGNTHGQYFEQAVTTEIILTGLVLVVCVAWAVVGITQKNWGVSLDAPRNTPN